MLGSCAAPRRLAVMHVNDTHSHLDPLRDGTCGIIERSAVVDSIRHAEGARHTLLLHAGDFNQGSSYYNVLKGELEVDLINALGYDCITLGNHEFDNGVEDLLARLNRIKCPVVCANYDFSSFDGGDKVQPYAIIKRGGYKVGIIGMLCDISTVVAKATVDRVPRLGEPAEIANSWAKYLRETQKCDIVIVLSHMGYREDCEFAAQSHGVDFVIGGHSHTRLLEPRVITDLDGHPVPVVQDGYWGGEVGELIIKD